ncbi:MFS transporter [Streptomyces sp. NPDC051172]|uniref:MFS transporter n=1 Tax=Streptomyces sp. NPDC051172 TaxID=3155796 RepID=UPI00343B4B3F
MTDRATTRRLLGSHALSSTATTLPAPLLATSLHSATHSATALALLGAARMVPYIALGSLAGRLADRMNRRHLLQASSVVRAVLFAALTTAVTVHAHVVLLIVPAVTAVVAGTPAYAACGAALPDILERAPLERATRALTAIEAGAWVAGPALGGLLLAVAPPSAGPMLAAGLAGVAALLLVGLPLPSPQPSAGPPAQSAWALLARVPDAVISVVAVNIAIDAVAAILVLLADSDEEYGLLAAGLGAGAAVCIATARWHFGVHLTTVTAATGTALIMAATADWPPARVALLLTAGTAAGYVEAYATTRVQHAVPSRRRGEALGALDQLIVTGALLGTILGPLATAWLTTPGTVAAAGCLVLAASLLSPARRQLRLTELASRGGPQRSASPSDARPAPADSHEGGEPPHVLTSQENR